MPAPESALVRRETSAAVICDPDGIARIGPVWPLMLTDSLMKLNCTGSPVKKFGKDDAVAVTVPTFTPLLPDRLMEAALDAVAVIEVALSGVVALVDDRLMLVLEEPLFAVAVMLAASLTVALIDPAVAVMPTLPVVVMVLVKTLVPDRLMFALPAWTVPGNTEDEVEFSVTAPPVGPPDKRVSMFKNWTLPLPAWAVSAPPPVVTLDTNTDVELFNVTAPPVVVVLDTDRPPPLLLSEMPAPPVTAPRLVDPALDTDDTAPAPALTLMPLAEMDCADSATLPPAVLMDGAPKVVIACAAPSDTAPPAVVMAAPSCMLRPAVAVRPWPAPVSDTALLKRRSREA